MHYLCIRKICIMLEVVPKSEKLSKKEIDQYFLDNNLSVRSIIDKFDLISKALDESPQKHQLNLMNMMVKIDKDLTRFETYINNEILAIKYLRELTGDKGSNVETILSDDNLLAVLNKIKESGYTPAFSGDVLKIQDNIGTIVVEYSDEDIFTTIRGGILKFLEYKGK